VAWLEQENIPAVIVGGIAASVLGRPRLTRDIDALMLDALDKLLEQRQRD
jgi:hypothetical protein